MKKAIATIINDSNETMTIFFNGDGEALTAEADDVCETTEYHAADEQDARDAARMMWGGFGNPWGFQEI